MYRTGELYSSSTTPFGCACDVSKFESSKIAGFTRVKDVLQDVSVANEKTFQKNFSYEKPSTKVTLRLGNSLMKPQCKFETSPKGQSRRTRGVFVVRSSLRRTSSHGNHNPRQNTGNRKGQFFIASTSQSITVDPICFTQNFV